MEIPFITEINKDKLKNDAEFSPIYVKKLKNYVNAFKNITPEGTTTNNRKAFRDILREERNLNLPLSISRASLISKYLDSVTEIDPQEFAAFSYCFQGNFKPFDENEPLNDFTAQELTKIERQEFFSNPCENNEKTRIKYSFYNIDFNRFPVIKLPREIYDKIMNIEKHFQDIKGKLKLHGDGFYYFKEVPVICLHQYMLLNGASSAEVSHRCYSRGVCCYCGQDLENYNEVLNDNLTTISSSLILRFCGAINENINAQPLYFKLYAILNNIVNEHNKNLNTNAKIDAFSALFVLKLLKQAKRGGIKLKAKKVTELSDKIAFYCSNVGWNETQIKNALKTFFRSIENADSLIRSFIYSDNLDLLFTVLPATILMNLNEKHENNQQNTEYDKTVQALYKSGKINEYNEKLKELLLKIWHYNYEQLTEEKQEYTTTNPANNAKNSGFNFFRIIWRYFCPVNYRHEFKKGFCSFCGIDKNGDNLKEIYNKFNEKINGFYMEEIGAKTMTTDETKTEKAAIINEINKTKEEPELVKIITDAEKIDENFFANLSALVKTLLNIEITEKNTLIKAVNYLIQSQKITRKELFENLMFLTNKNEVLLIE